MLGTYSHGGVDIQLTMSRFCKDPSADGGKADTTIFAPLVSC